jgi:hypothetical protein
MPVNVTTAAELTTALANAKAGDEIVLAAGTYALGNVNCVANGTAAAPIVVRSATALAARIDMTGLEGFKVSGAHWHFEGLDVHGVCTNDADCEHAFHVFGGATGFVMRGNRVVDFNAQLKVNATINGVGNAVIPHQGLVEYNELYDTHARNTDAPVTKLNIDTGDDWVVRGNVVRDFHRASGGVTYGVFLKSGGHRGLVERNLVICSKDVTSATSTIGLSFGGGGTAKEFCAPAFDATVDCAVEHEDGVMRNNVIAKCSDVGIYVNRGKNSRILFNTLVATSGIDFRFDTSSGEARGNVHAGVIQNRNAATATFSDNLVRTQNEFDAMYVAPLVGDLRLKAGGDLTALTGKVAAAVNGITDDYCARARGAAPLDLGALESSLGDCTTVPPPKAAGSSGDAGTDGGGSSSGGSSGTASSSSGGAASSSGGGASSGNIAGDAGDDGADDGCGCRATGTRGRLAGLGVWLAGMALVLALLRRRR